MTHKTIQVRDINASLDYILDTNCSVVRFGDGEMDLIAGVGIPYQPYHEALSQALKDIIRLQSNERLLVCLSDVFERTERYNEFCNRFWSGHLHHYQAFYKELCQADWYGSTFISRPYMDLVDKSVSQGYFAKLKQVWEQRDVLIVEGRTTRSGIGNDLFDNAKSLQRIICPSRNAFEYYQEIYDTILRFGKDKLILLMLGPTAKVLAYQLSKVEGYQAIDLGHIDSEYEWFRMGATHKVKLANKHTAEHNFDEGIQFLQDNQYNRQIVADVMSHSQNRFTLVYFIHKETDWQLILPSIDSQLYQSMQVILVYLTTEKEDSPEQIRFTQQFGETVSCIKTPSITPDLYQMILSQTQSDYITFVKADDAISENYLSECAALLRETDEAVDILLTNLYCYDENNQTFYFNSQPFSSRKVETSQVLPILEGEDCRYKTYLQSIFGKVFRRSYLEDRLSQVHQTVLDNEVYDGAQVQYANQHVYMMREYGNELVSIIVPVYNVEEYLVECVDSILAQTYRNIEILLIDDGSTDSSGRICDEYALKDSRIRVIHQENAGLSAARNTGLVSMTGSYVIFVDSDDCLEKQFVALLHEQAKTYNADIAVTDYYRYDAQTGMFYFGMTGQEVCIMDFGGYMDKVFSSATSFVTAWGKLFSTKLFFGSHTVAFPDGHLAEDKFVTYLLALKAKRIVYIPGANYHYRLRENSITKNSQSLLRLVEDDILGCETRLMDLVLTDYDVQPAIELYKSILSIHQSNLDNHGLQDTEIYRKISKKMDLLNRRYT